MIRPISIVIAAAGFVVAGASSAQQAPESSLVELDTVLVLGEQPGPGLWKVTKGDNVMWVLGSYGPLPAGMTWHSHEVESRVSESQEVIYPGGSMMGVSMNLLYGLTLVPSAFRAGKIPHGKTLKDVLPQATYAKWRQLRERYMGKDEDVERWRPAIALEMLRDKIGQQHRTSGGPGVGAVVDDAAKRHGVRINRLPLVGKSVRVEKPRSMLKRARELELPDLACFERDLAVVETDVARRVELANAWARGNIARLRELHSGPDPAADPVSAGGCTMTLMSALGEGDSAGAARAKKLLADMRWHDEQTRVQLRLDWLAAARKALDQNASTFTVLPIREVVRADGYLESLRREGYEIEEPL